MKYSRHLERVLLMCSVATLTVTAGYLIAILRNVRKTPRIDRYDVDNRYTNVATCGNLVFMSGQVGMGATIEEQTINALEEVSLALKRAGSNKERILELTIWLKDIKRDYNAMNSVYDAWIIPGKPPCRACVQAELYSPDCLVEVRVVASKE